ncbi:hypothetical protein [Mycoplasmopsis arginini]|uniref:Uncharacterized protein n=1 Tax=Mycoplasmopsis arginini TaxID=2094 RepID=A0AA43TW23_MYCAR|nr:hypothetical protein [Mycoplasmopsis arginini]MCY2902684.1 hypothetical protein [Mycoplasmopsis arginini QMP CG1-2758]MDI3349343.1 hypothetical protein [Mycoplasmopsis arginini]MDI3350343.1 hypothetical protein [Mycoplasmopsis arginini]MDI3350966.1 hypothetical protein [Mycoplasmopsis arginini]MDI3352266.1 hypothetical protein [Mycoplasmopsis arginini]
MKLKYVLTTTLANQEDKVVETEYIDFLETNNDKFTHIEFTDEKVMNCIIDICSDEVKITYANQFLHMKKNEFIENKLKISETGFISIDTYLIKVIINKDEISFTYDLLQNKNIIVRNTATLLFKND